MDDGDLVRRVRDGDAAAVETLLDRHFDFVHNVCRTILWRREDEDRLATARQVALTQIARHLAGFEGRSKLTTWMYPIARNAALAEARRRRIDPTDAVAVEAETTPGPEARVVLRDALDDCLDRLPAAYRDVLTLRLIGELDYQEIADRLGVVMGTVKQRISRGREALRRCLTGKDIEP
ncbi:MAG: RNA polymerase sigma factor [Acidimicrobiales bacterium]|nr:RNA polymerase sigma factor [Acidimicrobiales bacterium]